MMYPYLQTPQFSIIMSDPLGFSFFFLFYDKAVLCYLRLWYGMVFYVNVIRFCYDVACYVMLSYGTS